jgi:hypothetical protein
MLGRGGRLIRAIRAIGRGADAFEGSRFCFAIRPGDQVPPATPDRAAGTG